jgi:anhydro-N-acetylmuramic acid kinase
LDGLDVAFCLLKEDSENSKTTYEILAAKTYYYTEEWVDRLKKSPSLPYQEYLRVEKDWTDFCSECIKELKEATGTTPNLIANHGHTVYHDPTLGISKQMGNGAQLAAQTQTSVVCDFRQTDVTLGGQGAPLVPFGDKYLLGLTNNSWLNLGGIANITLEKKGVVTGFDICPCNLYINRYTYELGLMYDSEGEIARFGTINQGLLAELNSIVKEMNPPYPSLSIETLEKTWEKVLNPYKNQLSPQDFIATLTEHAAYTIGRIVKLSDKDCLATGGGAHNTYLLERINHYSQTSEVLRADGILIDFKEALIFAYLGYRRFRGEINTLPEVTGARRASSSGALYLFQ